MDDFTEITDLDQLRAARDEANTAAEQYRQRVTSGEALSTEELAELRGHFDRRNAARDRIAQLEAEADVPSQDDLAAEFETTEEQTDTEAQSVVIETEVVEVPSADVAPALTDIAAALSGINKLLGEAAEANSVTASTTSNTTTRPRIPRPEVPQPERALADLQVTLTAAASEHGIGVGSEITFEQMGAMAVRQLERHPKPSGRRGSKEAWSNTPLATFSKEYPEELQIIDGVDEQIVFKAALDQTRLSSDQGSGSLLAAGGWCAPSEQLYNLQVIGESLDGMGSFPEAQAKRGGIKHTPGPDFATLYAGIGFHQTEAQAIAGTTKPSYEVVCPSFTEDRLEVEGVFIKVPILTYAAYPELVNRVMSGAMVVHAHKMNAFKLAKAASLSTPKTATDLKSTAESTLRALELRAAYARELYRMSLNETLEVKVPHWIKGILKADLRLRSGNDATNVITDAVLAAHFASIGVVAEYVYDWEGLGASGGNPTDGMTYPATFKVMMYPAGTFLALTNDVINLSTVYDSAGLATNVYTGLFSEEGIQLAKMAAFSEVITMPVCSSGTTGSNKFECA